MELDTKQKVLIAIYKEYQEDIPNMSDNIHHDKLDLDVESFAVALDKLTNELLIIDAKISRGGSGRRIVSMILDNVRPTVHGIKYIEDLFQIKNTLNSKQKLEIINSRINN